MMHAGSQFPGNPHSFTGLGLLPAAVIKPIAHRGGNGLALQVTVAEGDGLQAVAQGLVRQVGLKECRALAQRDGGAGLMALTRLVATWEFSSAYISRALQSSGIKVVIAMC